MTTLAAAPNTTEGSQAATTAAPPVTASKEAPTTGTLAGGQQDSKPTEQGKAGEAKPAEQTKAEVAKPAGAPEKYEFKAPAEGHVLDAEVLKAYGEVARELNLTQESAQKVIDKLAPVMQERQKQALETVSNEWRQAAQNDKEFGGDKWPESVKVINRFLDKFGSPELHALLKESGEAADPLGRLHGEWLRTLYRAGKAFGQDTPVGGTQSFTEADMRDPAYQAQKLYGKK